MEVVSLGLLALASSAFLTKAKADSKKKKEAFADTLFGDVPGRTFKPTSQDFITRSASLFNPFSAILDVSKTSFTAAADGSMPSYDAPSNEKSANLFRSIFTKANVNGTTTIDDNRSEKSATIYRVPTGTILGQAINTCEAKTPIKNADGTANCSVFNDPNFSDTCGICHLNSITSDGNTSNAIKGLYVASRMRQGPSEQELQRRDLASNRNENLSRKFVKPTVGRCGSDAATNKNYFSLSQDICVATNKYLQCKNGQDFASSEGCYACRRTITGGANFNFVNSNVGLFSVRQPTTFTLGGKGKVNLRLYDENGTTPLGYLHSPNSEGILTLSSTSNDLTLNSIPPKYKIPLSNGEAAAGKYLVITLSKVNTSDEIPYVQGNFYGNLRGQDSPDITDFAQTALDITSLGSNITPLTGNNGSFIYYRNANDTNGMQMQPSIDIDRGVQNVTATFKVLIPYLYIDTQNIEATYCDGPFIKNSNSSALLSNNPCYAPGSGPGNYNSNCLSNIFIAAGCSNTGSNFPRDSATIGRLNGMGDKRTITSNINSLFNAAYSGFSNGEIMSDSNLLDAQRACFDSNIVNKNPCLNLSEFVQSNGPLNDQCIKYLYASGRTDDRTNREAHDPLTYSTSNAKSLFGNKKKDRYCTDKGTISPLDTSINKAANIELARTKGGIAALKVFYDNIHKKANQTDMTNAERAEYVLKCYGTTLDVQADSNPNTENGEDVAATNCGTGGLAIGNIKYVKIFAADLKQLRLSQVAVIDARGQNVALGKPVSGSAGTGNLASIVDGSFSLKSTPYVSNSNGNGTVDTGNVYISINLGGQYDIVQIIVFNTSVYDDQGGLSGAKVAIYDKNDGKKSEDILTAAPVQYINKTGSSPSKSCPQLMSGKRGDLLAGTTSIENNIALNKAALGRSVTYTKYNLGTVSSSTGIDINGGTTSSDPKAVWIWNHPYAFANGGSRIVSFYTTVTNPSSKQASYTICYKMINGNLSAELNSVALTLTGNSVAVKFVPGINLITFTCTPTSATSPTAFAALVKDFSQTIKSKTDADNSDWLCYTDPSIAGALTYPVSVSSKYNLSSGFGSGITNNGSANGSVAKWIWNHPYASVNAGSTAISLYTTINNTATTVQNYTLIYNAVNCATSIYVNINDTSVILTSSSATPTTIRLVPGNNKIFFTCRPTTASSFSGFAAFFTNPSGTIINTTDKDSSLWIFTTEPSIAGINADKTASGSIYKIYDTPSGNWYSDTTYSNYVKDTYSPGENINTAKWIWNQPEAALAAGTASATFYYDITGAAGTGVSYNLYFGYKETISITINGVNYSTSSSGFEFKVFNGLNRISVTVTPSSGSAGFIAYLTNSSGTVANSQTGLAGSGWKCDTSTTWSATTSCDFVGTGSKMTYNCAKTKFTAAGAFSATGKCSSDLAVDDYKNTFYNRSITDMNAEVAANWASKTAGSANQIKCRGATVCPDGYTYDDGFCYAAPTSTDSFVTASNYNSATKKAEFSYTINTYAATGGRSCAFWKDKEGWIRERDDGTSCWEDSVTTCDPLGWNPKCVYWGLGNWTGCSTGGGNCRTNGCGCIKKTASQRAEVSCEKGDIDIMHNQQKRCYKPCSEGYTDSGDSLTRKCTKSVDAIKTNINSQWA
jgi:hypothetical protein